MEGRWPKKEDKGKQKFSCRVFLFETFDGVKYKKKQSLSTKPWQPKSAGSGHGSRSYGGQGGKTIRKTSVL
jgi:hypothetical protein